MKPMLNCAAIVALIFCVEAQRPQSLSGLERQVRDIENRLFMLEFEAARSETVDLDPSQPNAYGKLETHNGTFLVSVGKVERYLDGYKLTIEIGNITSATYLGYEISAEWGKSMPKNAGVEGFMTWKKSLRSKDASYTGALLPGAWNRSEIILAPAGENQLGHLRLSMKTNTVRLSAQ